MRRLLPLALAAPLAFPAPAQKTSGLKPVLVAEYSGVISPVAAEFVSGAVARAEQGGFQALVIELDTPGGLDASMREAVKSILGSSVPVIVYVAPSGARAASAGVFLTMAAEVSAMAPGTNIGAAHPIMIGQEGRPEPAQKPGEKGDVLEEKIKNDAVAYLRSIARKRGHNADWAAQAVTQSSSTPAEEAVSLGVVDLEAGSLDELLSKLDGRRIPDLGVELHTRGAPTVFMEMTGRQRFLAALSDPNIAVILMSLGAAGLFIELYNPGLILPGIVGVVSLLLAFYSFQTLSANFAGVALILFGFVLFLLEVKVVSHGLLSLGGVAALALGFVMLFNQPNSMGLRVDNTVIAGTIGALLAVTTMLAWLYARAARRKPETGREELLGMEGVAKERLHPHGRVVVHGELWGAVSEEGDIPPGAAVRVVGQKGLTLRVRRAG